MTLPPTYSQEHAAKKIDGTVLIIVLWVALGLVTITLYFANAMN